MESHKRYVIVLAYIGALSGIVAILTYLDNRRNAALKTELLRLDKEIKAHQLYHEQQKTDAIAGDG